MRRRHSRHRHSFSDFTTGSKSLFRSDAKFITINTSRFDAYKLGAVKLVADAKLGIIALGKALSSHEYRTKYTDEIAKAKKCWNDEMERFAKYSYNESFTTLIKAQYERSVPEFAEKFGTITQVAAVEKYARSFPTMRFA